MMISVPFDSCQVFLRRERAAEKVGDEADIILDCDLGDLPGQLPGRDQDEDNEGGKKNTLPFLTQTWSEELCQKFSKSAEGYNIQEIEPPNNSRPDQVSKKQNFYYFDQSKSAIR